MSDWTVIDHDNDNKKTADSRSEAEEMAATAREFGSDNVDIYPPGELPDELSSDETSTDGGTMTEATDDSDDDLDGACESNTVPCAECGESLTSQEAEIDAHNEPYHPDCLYGGDGVEADFIDHSDDTQQADAVVVDEADPEPVEPTPEAAGEDLPDRSVADDPLTWIPGEFVDNIDGTQAINRKGFEVLSHFYGIDVHAECQTPPEDTGHEYCRVKARAVTDEGRQCEAFGSAHIERGDDPELLLEMAGTRARKRALSIATGVGAVAVSELKNQVQ